MYTGTCPQFSRLGTQCSCNFHGLRVPEEALGEIPIGFGIVVNDKLSSMCVLVCIHLSRALWTLPDTRTILIEKVWFTLKHANIIHWCNDTCRINQLLPTNNNDHSSIRQHCISAALYIHTSLDISLLCVEEYKLVVVRYGTLACLSV